MLYFQLLFIFMYLFFKITSKKKQRYKYVLKKIPYLCFFLKKKTIFVF